jgi:hypothetical protein
MAIKTTLEQIEEVQAAITKVMSGQDFTFSNGSRVSRADLDALGKRETQLLARYRGEQGTGGMAVNTAIMRRD